MVKYASVTSAIALIFLTSAVASVTIGHPVPTKVAAAKKLSFSTAYLPVDTVTFDRCNGTSETFAVNEVLDLVAHDTLTLAKGKICHITIDLDDDVTMTGTGSTGGTFTFELDVGQIDFPVSPMLVVTTTSVATDIRIAEKNWVTESMLGLTAEQHLVVNDHHTLHSALRDAVRYDSSVLQ